jgi:hypothetical protein
VDVPTGLADDSVTDVVSSVDDGRPVVVEAEMPVAVEGSVIVVVFRVADVFGAEVPLIPVDSVVGLSVSRLVGDGEPETNVPEAVTDSSGVEEGSTLLGGVDKAEVETRVPIVVAVDAGDDPVPSGEVGDMDSWTVDAAGDVSVGMETGAVEPVKLLTVVASVAVKTPVSVEEPVVFGASVVMGASVMMEISVPVEESVTEEPPIVEVIPIVEVTPIVEEPPVIEVSPVIEVVPVAEATSVPVDIHVSVSEVDAHEVEVLLSGMS